MLFPKSTRYAHVSRRRAALVVTLLAGAIVYGLVVYGAAPASTVKGNARGEDLRCYRRIVERVRAGEGYYEAAGDELRTRGYATRSPFNWRLPLLAWLLARLPSTEMGEAVAAILAIMTLLVWISVLGQDHHSFAWLAFGSLAVLGPVIYSLLPGIFLAHEFWAGTLISLSLASYARGWRVLSVVSGLMAIFLRELALPFVCVMLALSYREGRRREVLAWVAGMVAFGVALLFHWSTVRALTSHPGSLAQQGGWMDFGGWRFVLSTARMHPYLFPAPAWVTAVTLPLALLGLAGWCGSLGSRVAWTVFTYVLAFVFVGLPYNQYWGLMYTGIMLLGLLYVPNSVRDLWQSALSRRPANPAQLPLEGATCE
jgi:hypothetical protein